MKCAVCDAPITEGQFSSGEHEPDCFLVWADRANESSVANAAAIANTHENSLWRMVFASAVAMYNYGTAGDIADAAVAEAKKRGRL